MVSVLDYWGQTAQWHLNVGDINSMVHSLLRILWNLYRASTLSGADLNKILGRSYMLENRRMSKSAPEITTVGLFGSQTVKGQYIIPQLIHPILEGIKGLK